MTDRPIIFSAPMIRALLAGLKTQTRRLAWKVAFNPGGPILDAAGSQEDFVDPHEVKRPSPWQRVKPGDRLWVRESVSFDSPNGYGSEGFYRADGWEYGPTGGWKPSIHMPRRASRLTLTVTEVRLQHLHQAAPSDMRAEGIRPKYNADSDLSVFAYWVELWNSIHGAGAWYANPEIIALTFTVEQKNIDG